MDDWKKPTADGTAWTTAEQGAPDTRPFINDPATRIATWLEWMIAHPGSAGATGNLAEALRDYFCQRQLLDLIRAVAEEVIVDREDREVQLHQHLAALTLRVEAMEEREVERIFE